MVFHKERCRTQFCGVVDLIFSIFLLIKLASFILTIKLVGVPSKFKVKDYNNHESEDVSKEIAMTASISRFDKNEIIRPFGPDHDEFVKSLQDFETFLYLLSILELIFLVSACLLLYGCKKESIGTILTAVIGMTLPLIILVFLSVAIIHENKKQDRNEHADFLFIFLNYISLKENFVLFAFLALSYKIYEYYTIFVYVFSIHRGRLRRIIAENAAVERNVVQALLESTSAQRFANNRPPPLPGSHLMAPFLQSSSSMIGNSENANFVNGGSNETLPPSYSTLDFVALEEEPAVIEGGGRNISVFPPAYEESFNNNQQRENKSAEEAQIISNNKE